MGIQFKSALTDLSTIYIASKEKLHKCHQSITATRPIFTLSSILYIVHSIFRSKISLPAASISADFIDLVHQKRTAVSLCDSISEKQMNFEIVPEFLNKFKVLACFAKSFPRTNAQTEKLLKAPYTFRK